MKKGKRRPEDGNRKTMVPRRDAPRPRRAAGAVDSSRLRQTHRVHIRAIAKKEERKLVEIKNG